jgi:aspartyl protease family protein
MRNMKRFLLLALLALAVHPVGAVEKIALQALFRDKAIVTIDGARRVLTVGSPSPEGVTLLETDTRAETALVAIDGRRELLQLGVVVGAARASGKGHVTLYAQNGHFYADGTINGVPVRFLVDTGATTVALSGRDAQRLGIDYRRLGRAGIASTASGLVKSYQLTLARVEVGDIVLFNVDAGVVEGSFPREVLLGMSFLGQVDMRQDSQKLELMQR